MILSSDCVEPTPKSWGFLRMHAEPRCCFIVAHCKPSAGLLWLQDRKLHEPLDQVLEGLFGAGVRIGTALQQPGLLAASAAWDPNALPALCILAMASDAECPAADSDGRLVCMPSQMRPALGLCLRHVQADLMRFLD
jgi:hypothetical protein